MEFFRCACYITRWNCRNNNTSSTFRQNQIGLTSFQRIRCDSIESYASFGRTIKFINSSTGYRCVKRNAQGLIFISVLSSYCTSKRYRESTDRQFFSCISIDKLIVALKINAQTCVLITVTLIKYPACTIGSVHFCRCSFGIICRRIVVGIPNIVIQNNLEIIHVRS